jgi:hypothetical protein
VKKYGIQKTTTTLRIHQKDFDAIAELAMQQDYNLADATHKIVEEWGKQRNSNPCNKATNIPGLRIEGNRIVSVTPLTQPCNTPASRPDDIFLLPVGRPGIPKGTRIRMKDPVLGWVAMDMPELDGDNNPIL